MLRLCIYHIGFTKEAERCTLSEKFDLTAGFRSSPDFFCYICRSPDPWISTGRLICAVGSGFLDGQCCSLFVCSRSFSYQTDAPWEQQSPSPCFPVKLFWKSLIWHLSVIIHHSLTLFFVLTLSSWFVFLSSNDFSRMVAEEYLGYFNFTGQTLDQALRLVCSWSFCKLI